MRFLPESITHLILVYLAIFRPALVIFSKLALSSNESFNFDHFLFLHRGKQMKPEDFSRIFQSQTIKQGFTVSSYRDAFSYLVKYDTSLHLEAVIIYVIISFSLTILLIYKGVIPNIQSLNPMG